MLSNICLAKQFLGPRRKHPHQLWKYAKDNIRLNTTSHVSHQRPKQSEPFYQTEAFVGIVSPCMPLAIWTCISHRFNMYNSYVGNLCMQRCYRSQKHQHCSPSFPVCLVATTAILGNWDSMCACRASQVRYQSLWEPWHLTGLFP